MVQVRGSGIAHRVKDGINSYTHIAYADDINGNGFSLTDSNKSYIGIYADNSQAASTNPSSYKWTYTKGVKGDQGVPGNPGDDGLTPYFHTAYANDANGTNFSTTDPTGRTYIGTYTDYTSSDSNNPSLYEWILIKGDKGDKGDQGVPGSKGDTGPICYPAGLYDSTKTYTGTTTSIPVVLFNNIYYRLKVIGSITGISPTDSTKWEAFNMLEYVFTKILFSDFGKMASAIFSKDFMFSQQGTINVPVFKWGNSTPATPSGGTYANPIPSGWSNIISSGSGNLYYSIKKFSTDGSEDTAWSSPVWMTNSSSYQLLYSAIDSPTDPNTSTSEWSSSIITGAKWFAISSYVAGSWGKYVVYKVMSTFGYENFSGGLRSNDAFIPNIAINFLTGLMKAKNVDLTGTINALSGMIGLFNIFGGDIVGSIPSGTSLLERLRLSINSIPSLSDIQNGVWNSIYDGSSEIYPDDLSFDISSGYVYSKSVSYPLEYRTIHLDNTSSIKLSGSWFGIQIEADQPSISISKTYSVQLVNSSGTVIASASSLSTILSNVPSGDYILKVFVNVTYGGYISVSEYSGDTATFNVSLGYTDIQAMQVVARTMVGSNGLYSRWGTTNYEYYSKDDGKETKFGTAGFKVGINGFQKWNEKSSTC